MAPTAEVLALFLALSQLSWAKSIVGGAGVYGCTAMDHAACDEVCKTDGFWYGHCTAWNGVDFQCRCFDYKAPLDRRVCANMQEYCAAQCFKKGKDGGYCYPALNQSDPRGVPSCQCFDVLPQFL